MSRVNDRPVSEQNPLPSVTVIKDALTGKYSEVDSNSPEGVIGKLRESNGDLSDPKGVSGVQEVMNRLEDPQTSLPTTIKNVSGKQRVSSTSYEIEIAQGNIPNHTNFSLNYSTEIVPTATSFATNIVGGEVPRIEHPSVVEIVSTSANDSSLAPPPTGGGTVGIPATGWTVAWVSGGYPIGTISFVIGSGTGDINHGDLVSFGSATEVYTVDAYTPIGTTYGTLTITNPTTVEVIPGVTANFQQSIPNIGVHSVMVVGLDDSGKYYEEEVQLSGTVPVFSTGSFSTVNYMFAKTAYFDSSGSAGTITCKNTIPANFPAAVVKTLQQISFAENKSGSLYFRMPTDKKGFISVYRVSSDIGTLKTCLRTTLDEYNKTPTTIFTDKSVSYTVGQRTEVFTYPLSMAPGTEMKFFIQDLNSTGMRATISIEIFMEDA